MKLYMAEGAYGGFKWISDYYKLDNPNFCEIGDEYIAGDTSAAAQADQAAGGELHGHDRLPRPLVRHHPARHEARVPARDLLRRREEADRGPVPVRPPRQQAPHQHDRRHRRRTAPAAKCTTTAIPAAPGSRTGSTRSSATPAPTASREPLTTRVPMPIGPSPEPRESTTA
ncbi:MAG: hypothetical protein MZV64_64000 [Ignavibacteriales bacterium]|nr:hypothetical protein [Ignavibacteriales bacterium]